MNKAPKRTYDGTSRRKRASLTRTRIMDAARRLFAARGLDRVTFDALAAEAGVSAATIYALFRSKAGLLRAMMEASLFNERYRALAERTRQVEDPVELLRMTASIARAIYDGEKAQLGLVRGASAFSTELRDVEQQFERARFDLQADRARRIARKGTARPGLGLERVRDILWMFTGRDVYRMLVVERGWTSDAYERWLSGTLVRALLKG
jgi:AcrR family transcriptional regulator